MHACKKFTTQKFVSNQGDGAGNLTTLTKENPSIITLIETKEAKLKMSIAVDSCMQEYENMPPLFHAAWSETNFILKPNR